jgi:raffinose/stachyose/melibiose transport system substrate-binding protein
MKRFLFLVTVVLVSASVLSMAACGSKKQSDDELVTIEFYQQKVEAIQIVDELIARFESKNPGIKVKQTNLPNSETRNVLLMRIAANDVPDLLSAYPNAPEFREFVKEGYLYDLSGKEFLKNVNPAVLSPIKLDGKDYSLPISLNTIGVHYNQTIFDKYGLTIPATYEQFLALGEKLKQEGIQPLAFSDKDSWTAGIFANCSLGKEMGKAETDSFFAALAKGTVSAKNNPDLRKIAGMVVDLRTRFGTGDTAAFGYNDAINSFATEKTAMYINGIWAIPSIVQSNPELKFSMFPIPATAGKETTTIYGIDFAVSMAADTKHPQESLKFLEFLASPENAQYFSDIDNSPSVINGVKVKSERIASLVTLLNAGKAFEWNHFKWADGMEGRFNDAVQELAIVRDVDAFLAKLDTVFKE